MIRFAFGAKVGAIGASGLAGSCVMLSGSQGVMLSGSQGVMLSGFEWYRVVSSMTEVLFREVNKK